MENFIMDGDKVSNCATNLAKMSVIEMIKYIYGYKKSFLPISKIPDFLALLGIICHIVLWILQPIFGIFSTIIIAKVRIAKAKKEVEKFNQRKNIHGIK